jgi:hypothetical protein
MTTRENKSSSVSEDAQIQALRALRVIERHDAFTVGFCAMLALAFISDCGIVAGLSAGLAGGFAAIHATNHTRRPLDAILTSSTVTTDDK